MVMQRLRERFSALWKRDAGPPERWVVVDTETSGLDPQRDALLAVGAVAVDADGIRVADSFEVVLQHEAGRHDHVVTLQGVAQSTDLRHRRLLVAAKGKRPDAGVDEQHHRRDRSAL